MTTHKSIRRSDNIIPIPGAKGTAYKVLLRFKGKGTICKTFPTMKEARNRPAASSVVAPSA